jgi:hypothetical protein
LNGILFLCLVGMILGLAISEKGAEARIDIDPTRYRLYRIA